MGKTKKKEEKMNFDIKKTTLEFFKEILVWKLLCIFCLGIVVYQFVSVSNLPKNQIHMPSQCRKEFKDCTTRATECNVESAEFMEVATVKCMEKFHKCLEQVNCNSIEEQDEIKMDNFGKQ